MASPQLFLGLQYTDCARAAQLLTAMGFTQTAWYADDDDPTVVYHAEFRWRDHGGVMLGSTGQRGPDDAHQDSPGTGQCYLVVADDDEVDRVHAAALAAGADEVQAPQQMDYGGRGSTVRDFDGNQWSIGSYQGA